MNRRTLLVALLAAFIGGAIVHFMETTMPSASPKRELAAIAAAVQKHAPSPSTSAKGTVRVSRVIDGDTVELASGERVRLIGIDTPESVDPRKPVQCFAKEAATYTRSLLEGKAVRLVADVEDRDKYGRLLRYVHLNDETFVNLALVRDGYARVYTYPPNVAHAKEFVGAEREAREAQRGLWGNICASPGVPTSASEIETPGDGESSGNCTIKGNIGSTGERIYHLPSCPYYAKTRIETEKGERMFCSETEALAAGWRKARNCP